MVKEKHLCNAHLRNVAKKDKFVVREQRRFCSRIENVMIRTRIKRPGRFPMSCATKVDDEWTFSTCINLFGHATLYMSGLVYYLSFLYKISCI